jgi:hypothetical protein
MGAWEGTEIHAGCMMGNSKKIERHGFEYSNRNDIMILK